MLIMKNITHIKQLVALAIFSLLLTSVAVRAQTTEFTYQGKLNDGGVAASGSYDLEFRLFETDGGGTPLATLQRLGVSVSNGVFTVSLDFGATHFTGADRFLEMAVRPAGSGEFTTLSPRQRMTSIPYALKTASAASADSLSGSCVGCVQDANIDSVSGGKVTGAVNFATSSSIAGNVTGTVQIANGGTGSATQNFVDLTTTQANIGGNKTFTGSIAVTGQNGVFSGNGSGLTNLDGSNIAENTINATALRLDTFPQNRNLTLLGSLRWDLLGQSVSVGSSPQFTAFDGANIWVANFNSNSVTKVRIIDGAVQGTFGVGTGPIGMAFDGTNIWVANTTSNNVTKLRASDGALQGTFAVGNGPVAVAFDGAHIWAANHNSNNVTKLRASDGAVQSTFAAGSGPRAVAFDGANIWVTNQMTNNVTKMQASDGAVQGTFAVGSGPRGVAFDGVNIWIANLSSNSMTKLRASDGAVQGTFALASNPVGVAFDGANIWVTHFSSSNVRKLRASDGTLLETFVIGTSHRGVAFDGANMWIVNNSADSLVRLPLFQ